MYESIASQKVVAIALAFGSLVIGWHLDGSAILLYGVVAALDILAGLIYYGVNRRLRSRGYIDGLMRKSIIAIFIAAMVYLEQTVLKIDGISTAAAVFYAVGEVLSIAEKLVALGAPIPKWLRDRLHEYQEGEQSDATPD